MPGYRGHLLVGALVWVCSLCIVGMLYNFSFRTGVWLIFTLLGALFPDIDTKSQGQRLFYLTLLICYPILIYYHQFEICLFLGFVSLIPLLVRHRGIFHTYWFLGGMTIGCTLLLRLCFPLYAKAVMVNACFFLLGAYSHVFVDRMLRK